MNILLVNPEAPTTYWGFKNALKFISKKAALPPLGLLTVAAMLPREWDKRLVDMGIEKLRDSDIEWADYVFLTAMAIHAKSVQEVIQRCKALGTKIVGGGPLFTTAPEDYPQIDHLVLNEAEITLGQFVRDVEAGQAKHIYRTGEWADLAETPVPLWELAKLKKYAVACVQYSRGCPFGCDFCDVTALFGHRMRTKSAGQMLAELDRLYSAGWRGQVFVVDDNFIGNKTKLKRDLLPAMIEWMRRKSHPFAFNTQASVNLADDDELMRLMAEAGFESVFVGIETPDEQGLTECNKVQNTGRDLVDCVKKIQRSGMQVQAGFILGFDSDKASVFENLIRFIEESGIVMAMVGLLNAPRGTRLYRRLKNEQRLLSNSSGNNTDFSINFIPKMTLDDLLAGYKRVVGTIYSHKQYYRRIRTFLKNYRPTHHGRLPATGAEVRAFLKSIWHLGILGKGRLHYWGLILRSLWSPRRLQLAVTLAIYGFHFRKVFEDSVPMLGA